MQFIQEKTLILKKKKKVSDLQSAYTEHLLIAELWSNN